MERIAIYKVSSLKRNVLMVLAGLLVISLCVGYLGLPAKMKGNLLIFRGNLAYETGAYDDAEVLYQSGLKANPGSAAALYNMGNALYKQERYQEAIVAYKKELLIQPGLLAVNSYGNLGNAYYKTGDLNLSAAAYKSALMITPDNAAIRQNLVFVLTMIDATNSKIAINKTGEKKPSAEKNSESKSKSDDKNQNNADQHDKPSDSKFSANNLADLFSLLKQNEQSANGRLNKSKSKNKVMVTKGQDY